MAAAADWLDRQPQLGREVFARGQPEAGVPGRARRAGEGAGLESAVAGDITALLRACLGALRVPTGAGIWQSARAGLWRVADAVARVRQVLDAAPDGEGAELEMFLPRIAPGASERELRCRAAVASTFLAWLELARDGALTLEQDMSWYSIHVRRRDGSSQHGDGEPTTTVPLET